MIPCKHCNTPNSLDSTFCKRCGTGLPEDEIAASRLKLEKIVEEGVHALNLGKLEEAMAIAETAVTADPSMSSAYSLKASVHERRGQIAEALECAERLVELNPDSELDKIKRNQLRAALGASAMNNQAPSRGVAALAAFSAVVILICGIVLGGKWFIQKQVDNNRLVSNTPIRQPETTQIPPTFSTPPTVPTNQTLPSTPTASTAPPANPTGSSPNIVKGPVAGDESATEEDQPVQKRQTKSGDVGSLPNPNAALEVSPIVPPSPPAETAKVNTSQPTQKKNDADPNPTPEMAKQSPPPDPGQIEIRVHEDAGTPRRISNSGGSSANETPKDTGKVYMKMGNDYFQMGNYSGAASSLEKAVSSGADPVRANVRLAQSYSSLGKKSEAAEAYKRAIAAASSSLSSGKGDSAKLKAVRDEAEAALRQIQGG